MFETVSAAFTMSPPLVKATYFMALSNSACSCAFS